MEREFGENPSNQTLTLIKANLQTKKNKVMVFLYGPMEANILEILLTILGKDMGRCIGVMELFTKENGKMEARCNKSKNKITQTLIPIIYLMN